MRGHMREISTGWFGVPGARSGSSSKVHLVAGGKPICGARLGPKMEYQFCSSTLSLEYVECEPCRKAGRKLCEKAIRAVGETRCPIR